MVGGSQSKRKHLALVTHKTKDFNEPNRIGESRIPTLPALNLIKEVDSELLSDHDSEFYFPQQPRRMHRI